jgi:hypothetical protein
MTTKPYIPTIQQKLIVIDLKIIKDWAISKMYCLLIRPKYEQRSVIDNCLNSKKHV